MRAHVCLSFTLNRIQSRRKGHATLHFLFKNACYTPNNELNGSEMTDMIKQVSNVIPVNKGWSTEWADVSRLCVLCRFHVFTLIGYLCVGRVLPVTHNVSLALRNIVAKQSGKPWVGVELPELFGTRQDRT